MQSHHAYTIVYIRSVARPPMSASAKVMWQSHYLILLILEKIHSKGQFPFHSKKAKAFCNDVLDSFDLYVALNAKWGWRFLLLCHISSLVFVFKLLVILVPSLVGFFLKIQSQSCIKRFFLSISCFLVSSHLIPLCILYTHRLKKQH